MPPAIRLPALPLLLLLLCAAPACVTQDPPESADNAQQDTTSQEPDPADASNEPNDTQTPTDAAEPTDTPDAAPADATLPPDAEDSSPPDATAPSPPTPVSLGPPVVVYTPSNGRYLNEPTLIRGPGPGPDPSPDPIWHVFANSNTGKGEPWGERQLLHATAPTLHGPWTTQPDILTATDPGSTDGVLHAPFVFKDGPLWRILYFDSTKDEDVGLRTATSPDLWTWTREPKPWPGGRDPMVLQHPGGNLLYTTISLLLPDGRHDAVRLDRQNPDGTFTHLDNALYDPAVCPYACWGWFESPFVVQKDGHALLFFTWTSTVANTPDYLRTAVMRSTDPTHFDFGPPLTELFAHGAEWHEEDGQQWLTSGGWPERIGEDKRGLWVQPVGWK